MATIVASSKLGFSLGFVNFHDLTEGSDYRATPTEFRVSYGGGEYDEFRGTGFKYNADGYPVAGTVKSYSYVSGDGVTVRLTDLSVKAVDIAAAARTTSTADDLALINRELGGADEFVGGRKNDTFSSLGGSDDLSGGAGKDRLDGGDGKDTISGGAGNDFLTGGSGGDRFRFDAPLGKKNVDSVTDFEAGSDRFSLDGDLFKGLGTGRLDADDFHVGAEAADRSDRIVYNDASGKLFYDPDGSGKKDAIAFARLDAGLDLDAGDFLLF